MANKKIRIRLKAYEHRTLDTAAAKIVELIKDRKFVILIRLTCKGVSQCIK